MLKRFRKGVVFLLVLTVFLGMSIPALAADTIDKEETVVINLFDPEDPNLIAIVDTPVTTRTTSRPTAIYDLAQQGQYSYSAYSNNNIMWTKYKFYTQDGEGKFFITAKSTNTNYRMVVHNCSQNKDYYYEITGTSVSFYAHNVEDWSSSQYFYFGIDTTVTGSAVSVDGVVDTY